MLELRQKMERWCAYQDRCVNEAIQKLKTLGASADELNALIEELKANRFLDDERFVESFVSGKFKMKQWGKYKIKMHLRQKGLSDELIEQGIERVIDDEMYEDTIDKLVQKKRQSLLGKELNSYEINVRIQRYLYSKGFEIKNVEKFIRN